MKTIPLAELQRMVKDGYKIQERVPSKKVEPKATKQTQQPAQQKADNAIAIITTETNISIMKMAEEMKKYFQKSEILSWKKIDFTPHRDNNGRISKLTAERIE